MSLLKRIYREYVRQKDTVKYARSIGVSVGINTVISPLAIFSSEPYLIEIGDNVQITNNVQFFTHGGGHILRAKYPRFDSFGKIKVCNNVYVGANSLILPGVTIGEGALVAAGSVVTRSVPSHTIVAGNPAKIICTTEQFAIKYKGFNTNTYGLSENKKRKVLLSLAEDRFIVK